MGSGSEDGVPNGRGGKIRGGNRFPDPPMAEAQEGILIYRIPPPGG